MRYHFKARVQAGALVVALAGAAVGAAGTLAPAAGIDFGGPAARADTPRHPGGSQRLRPAPNDGAV